MDLDLRVSMSRFLTILKICIKKDKIDFLVQKIIPKKNY